MIVMARKICDMDCFNCIFDDCKYDGSQTAKEGLMLRNAGCPTDKELKAKEPKKKRKQNRIQKSRKSINVNTQSKIKKGLRNTKRSTTKNTKTNLCGGQNKSMKEEKPLRRQGPRKRQQLKTK